MAKASLIGLITQGPELQHSAKGEPYVRFSVAEYVGFGSQRHTQFVDVWAWAYMAQRLAKCSLSNGDFMAIGAIKAIKAHGLRIPQDIAVVGFDNLSLSSMIEPSLTTMRPPALQMGRMAAKIACSADRHTFEHENEFDVKMVIRKSSDETCSSEWELTGW